MNSLDARVAVVGAGVAGAACARLLSEAGFDVHLFDKSRGIGGRMATRRVEWAGDDGIKHTARFDHGAPEFSARSPAFVRFVEQACSEGVLSAWLPRLAPLSHAPSDDAALWVSTPDMPALCRWLTSGVPVQTDCTVDALRRTSFGWCLESEGSLVAKGFSAVVVAIPPRQAAPLLQAHRADWAARARALPMLPGWALMGVTDDEESFSGWELALPTSGPLARVVRNDAKPGRERVPGLAHWVVHAEASWSQAHLESSADSVQSALQAALGEWLGCSLSWHHAAVHRWRYATVPCATDGAPASRCWWDAPSGLGMCGDALGSAGVEGAWCSAHDLATVVIDQLPGSQALGHVAPFRLAQSMPSA